VLRAVVVLLLAVESPVDYWADDYFFVHMIQHLLLMFAAPSLIVAGAPGQPLLAGLPGQAGRSATRGVLAGGWSAVQVADALERDPHTIGAWLAGFRQAGPAGLTLEDTGGPRPRQPAASRTEGRRPGAVPYTHLTLPTHHSV